MGYVYLLLEVTEDGLERHKIGITKNDVDKRVRQLQTGNSNKISVLKTYESINYKKIEKWLHNEFINKRTESENEWFKLSDEDVIGFTLLCNNADKTINFLKETNHFYK